MVKRSLIDQLDQAITAMFATGGPAQSSVAPEIAPLARIAAELRHLPRASSGIGSLGYRCCWRRQSLAETLSRMHCAL